MRIEVLDNFVIVAHGVDGTPQKNHLVKTGGVPHADVDHQRRVFSPGDDLAGEPQLVQTIARAVWTDAVIAASRAARA